MARREPGGKRTLEVEHDECRFQRFRIVVTGGPDRGSEQTSSGAELAIGGAEGNDLVLADPTVSRHHAVIAVTAQGFHVRDLCSTNGTPNPAARSARRPPSWPARARRLRDRVRAARSR